MHLINKPDTEYTGQVRTCNYIDCALVMIAASICTILLYLKLN